MTRAVLVAELVAERFGRLEDLALEAFSRPGRIRR